MKTILKFISAFFSGTDEQLRNQNYLGLFVPAVRRSGIGRQTYASSLGATETLRVPSKGYYPVKERRKSRENFALDALATEFASTQILS
jgi:hypothetical protein